MSDDDKACDPAESELLEVVDGIPESKHMEFFFSETETASQCLESPSKKRERERERREH